jgi:uncharacterized protein (TIGR03086 family)
MTPDACRAERADRSGEVMDEVATMRRVIDVTGRVVDNIEPDQLDNPSPCSGWTVRDVLNHVVAGAEIFTVCVTDGSIADERFVELTTTDRLGDDYKASFHRAADAADESFAVPGAMDRLVHLPFGEMPAAMAVNIAIFDVTTHAWDLAKATGQPTDLDADVVDRAYQAAQAMLSEELRATGRFGPAVATAADASVSDRLAAFTGRVP